MDKIKYYEMKFSTFHVGRVDQFDPIVVTGKFLFRVAQRHKENNTKLRQVSTR